MGAAIPVLRVGDGERARDFYVRNLGFGVVFEHRFEPGMPLYLRVARGDARIDLSEHLGDGDGSAAVWIPVADVEALRDDVASGERGANAPEVDREAPGGSTLTVVDPWGNQLRFCEPTA